MWPEKSLESWQEPGHPGPPKSHRTVESLCCGRQSYGRFLSSRILRERCVLEVKPGPEMAGGGGCLVTQVGRQGAPSLRRSEQGSG